MCRLSCRQAESDLQRACLNTSSPAAKWQKERRRFRSRRNSKELQNVIDYAYIIFLTEMFNYFKYRRLNNFLSDADFNSRSNSKPKLERIAWAMDTVLNIYTEEGKQNYEKLMETLYENQPAASRIKLLVLISQLIL